MTSAVVDASVAAKWVLNEAFSEQAALLLGYEALHAPSHWRVEAVNAIWGTVYRGHLASADGRERASSLTLAPVIETDVTLLMADAFDIAVAAGVTIYDALYVALAEAREIPLVTADQRLIRRLQGRPGALLQWVGAL